MSEQKFCFETATEVKWCQEKKNRAQSYEVGESWNDCVKEKKNSGLKARVCVCVCMYVCVSRQWKYSLQVLTVGTTIFVVSL
jgi:hypothetical protein